MWPRVTPSPVSGRSATAATRTSGGQARPRATALPADLSLLRRPRFDEPTTRGKIAAYGVSVEKAGEALKAIEFPGVVSVRIIHNIFRRRPAALFFPQGKRPGREITITTIRYELRCVLLTLALITTVFF